MGTKFIDYQPNQLYLLPQNPEEWLPEEHLVYFIRDTVTELDLSRFYQKYQGDGRRNQPYHPSMLIQILLYGYCTGVFSSRKLAKKIEEDIAFRVLAADNRPHHTTLCRFRDAHLSDFEDIFRQVLSIAREAKLCRLGVVAIDGSKLKANASRHKAMSYERMNSAEKELKKQISEITRRARGEDAAEDVEFGEEFRGDELPQELSRRESRLAAIRAAKKRLEQRTQEEKQSTPEAKSQENFTDPESRIMKTAQGDFQQCYNTQIAVDADNHLIVACAVSQSATDSRQLIPMLQQVQTVNNKIPDTTLADAGYKSEDNFKSLMAMGANALVSLGKEDKTLPSIAPDKKLTKRMAKKLKGKKARKLYKKRKAIVEPAYSWIKQVLGFKKFSVRGLKKVCGEWSLVCCALNLRRLNSKIQWVPA